MLKQLLALVLVSSLVFSQGRDSLLIQKIHNISDTSFVEISDTASFADSIIAVPTTVKVDTLFPIQGMPLTDVSTIISKRTFLFDQYRYTGDLLRSFSLNFVKDLGFIGYPNETFIYGVGNSGISFLQDGVYWNNRYTNTLDLNLLQSENIDSIEIVPSPRGFLYGPYNNPVTVNFITRDFISPQPYARIRYYEGPDGEAMIDGKFSTMVAKRWNYSFQLTNRSKDETYKNTDLSIWQFNTKLKYFLSNSVNLQAYYYYVKKIQGLNGGVDYDSLSRSSADPNKDLYDPIAAPVRFPNQKLDVLQHNVGLRTLAKPFDDSQLDLSIYYRYGLDELRDFSRDSIEYKSDKRSKSYGAALNYYYTYDFLTLQLFGNYKKSDIDNISTYYTSSLKEEFYNLGGLITLHTSDKKLNFSIFYKDGYSELTDYSYNGLGADLKYNLVDEFSFYAGFSLRQVYELGDQLPTIEGGFNYKNFNLVFDLKYFSNEYFNQSRWTGGPEYIHDYSQKNEGVGVILNYKLWILLLETNSTFYFNIENEPRLILPKWQFIGGLYVNDHFFDNNLDLKAGFKFYYTGEIKSSEYWWLSNSNVEPTNKLDFNLAGEIKKVAIFYFQWENLFNNLYYITPYYPMPERNIKFGIAWELFN